MIWYLRVFFDEQALALFPEDGLPRPSPSVMTGQEAHPPTARIPVLLLSAPTEDEWRWHGP